MNKGCFLHINLVKFRKKGEEKKVKKAIKIIIPIVILGIVVLAMILHKNEEKEEIIAITSQKELERIYNQEIGERTILEKIVKLPFSLIMDERTKYIVNESTSPMLDGTIRPSDLVGNTNTVNTESTKEYSTTNIQVENVDEADITKTDGDYIYSLSENDVIITDVKEPEQMKIVAKISQGSSNIVPEDLILYQNKLIVIYANMKSHSSYYKGNATYVAIYDIQNRETPKKIKSYELEQPYYTSRCIEGKLYVIATGRLKKENDKIITYYKEDEKEIDPGFNQISRIRDLDTDNQTILSMLDLNKIQENVKISSYLMNIENAYVSENNIYLLEEKYKSSYSSKEPKIIDIFGWKGLIGAFDEEELEEEEYGYYTDIYKFNLLEDGSIRFAKKATERGKTINQFSMDEYKNNLRLALNDKEGSRIVVFDENMRKIGQTENLAKGEKMYSSRFLGEKAYLVTYQTIDPLFVIDLSNPSSPKALGELKIPGYSTYLHPYDENHIIGIGMQTEEKVNRNANGRVTSTTASITGMKMALFDVSDVKNPIQISETIIGDRRTTSAVLSNHKALLFSKEKQLLAIPVNNYEEDFEIQTSTKNYETIINQYTNYNKPYISEGYFVYQINLTDGIKLKGTITHEKTKNTYNRTQSRLLRGLYIENNLYTISEDYIKINQLEDLKEINQLKIKEGNENKNEGRN